MLRVAVAVVATLITLLIYGQMRGDRVWSKLHEIELQVAQINASRFTSEDGKQVWIEFSKVRQDMAMLPQEAPPPWFEERVNLLETALKSEIGSLREDVQDIRIRLQRLEGPGIQ